MPVWQHRNGKLDLNNRTAVMGILNITPDSFSDGGRYLDPDRAAARAMELEAEGADILDIGPQSTGPAIFRFLPTRSWSGCFPCWNGWRGGFPSPFPWIPIIRRSPRRRWRGERPSSTMCRAAWKTVCPPWPPAAAPVW